MSVSVLIAAINGFPGLLEDQPDALNAKVEIGINEGGDMDKYEELLNEARKMVGIAMMDVQNASTMIHNFNKSKPLNVLYKELRASEALLNYYTGMMKDLPKDGYEIATPQSINTYHNLNST